MHVAAAAHYSKTSIAMSKLCEAAGAAEPQALAKKLELLIEGAVTMRMINGDNSAAAVAKRIAEHLLEKECGEL